MRQLVVGIHEARTNLSNLVKRVEASDEVIVTRFGRPVAKLVAYASSKTARHPGLLAGRISIEPELDKLPAGFEAFR